MDDEWIHDRSTLPCLNPRIAFRQIARSTDSRTIIPALVPPKTILTHHAWYFIWPEGTKRDEAYLLGVLSSIPFDWYARRFVEANVTKSLMSTFPVPRPDPENPLRQRVVNIAGNLAAIDSRYKEWADELGVEWGSIDEDEKEKRIHELDAVVSHLYGLSRNQVEVVFETFHEGWDNESRLNSVLEYYDEWERKLSEKDSNQ